MKKPRGLEKASNDNWDEKMEDNKNVCSIICGAPCKVLKKYVEGYIIAADSGLDRCLEASVKPDLVVGDFDSVKSGIPKGVEVIRVKPEKDDTDTVLAARTALERGFTELRFFCAFGGRISHSLANLQTLNFLKRKKVGAAMFGENCVMFLLNKQTVRIPKFNGCLSVFALEKTAIVSERGVKYPLLKRELSDAFPLGVSNEITADIAEISVHSGLCAVILEGV